MFNKLIKEKRQTNRALINQMQIDMFDVCLILHDHSPSPYRQNRITIYYIIHRQVAIRFHSMVNTR